MLPHTSVICTHCSHNADPDSYNRSNTSETVADFCVVYVFTRLSASSRIAHLLPEEQVYLNQQSGTIRLDCFTHCLIVKCAPDITVSQFSLSSCFLKILFRARNAAILILSVILHFHSYHFILCNVFWLLTVGVLC